MGLGKLAWKHLHWIDSCPVNNRQVHRCAAQGTNKHKIQADDRQVSATGTHAQQLMVITVLCFDSKYSVL